MELQHFLSYYWFDWGFFFIFHHTPGEINELIFGTKISGERRAIFKSIFFNLDWQCSAPVLPAKKRSNHLRSKVEVKNTQLLDVGCGPSIANIISASKYFNRITMADYLTSNRNEVERFVEQNADFEWMHYFQYVSDLEHDPNVEDIIQRTRNSIEVNITL